MNITTLQYFISAAELSSFTQAAKKHFVAQTAISQQIAKLENHLEVKLFIREANRVVLTDAGQVFYEDIKNIVREYELACKKVRRFHREEKKVITIGYKERAELHLLTETIHEFQKLYPQVEFVIKEGSVTNLKEEVKHGLCDIFVNISCTLTSEDMESLDQYTIYNGSMVLGMSIEHPKATREFLEASELGDEKFIVLNVDNSCRGFDEMHRNCKKDGYELQIEEFVPNIGAQLMKVELNKGVAFIQDLMANPQEDRIRFIPIRNSAHRYKIAIIWNKNKQEEFSTKFLQMIKNSLPSKKA